MKHIKKRFYFNNKKDQLGVNEKNAEFFNLDDGFDDKQLIGRKGTIAFIQLEDSDDLIGGIVNNVNGKNYIIPIPDPTLIYFNNAQLSLKDIKNEKSELLKKLNFSGVMRENSINEIYTYFGRTSGFVIFLFTAMESFLNQMIPDDFLFHNELPRKTEIYNKKQIQENLDFKTKITKVLKSATGKDFFQKSTPANQIIFRLKDFRDDIIHTKDDGEIMKYDKILKNALEFPYDKALVSVAKFMNFHRKDYIVECGCGADF